MNSVNTRKRARDEDEEELTALRGDTKKLHILPFRRSPTTQHSFGFSQSIRKGPRPILSSGLLTPTKSIEDVSERAEVEQPAHPYHTPPRTKSSSHLSEAFTQMRESPDQDVDMAEGQDSPIAWWQSPPPSQSSPIPSPLTLTPNTRHLSVDNAASARIPTPIYGHFQSLDVMDTDDHDFTRPRKSHLNLPARPRAVRLPTAIEEDECMESFEEGESAQPPLNIPSFEIASISKTTTRRSSFMDKLKSWAHRDGLGSEKRSGKAVLSMGFRADCQKCLNKVPGHYNHVIRE